MNNWTSFGEILKKAPFKIEDSGAFVSSTSFAEASDSTKLYFLRIVSSLPIGQVEPYDLAKKKISYILLNKKKSDFIIQFEMIFIRMRRKKAPLITLRNNIKHDFPALWQ